jgi:hypothetical protein
MKKGLIFAAVIVLGLGLAVGREESAEAEHSGHHDSGAFERNVQISFELVDEEGKVQGDAFIVTAVPQYKMMAKLKNAEETAVASTSGAVSILENDQILVMLEAEILLVGEEGDSELNVATAVRLRSGQEQEVAKMAEMTLIVGAAYLD